MAYEQVFDLYMDNSEEHTVDFHKMDRLAYRLENAKERMYLAATGPGKDD
jgi:hypothetical protein